MREIKRLRSFVLGISLSMLTATSYAESSGLNLSLPENNYNLSRQTPLYLAVNNVGNENHQQLAVKASPEPFEEPLFSENKIHQYLGLGTLGMVVLSAISPKEEDGIHEYAAVLAAAGGAATVTSGLISHWDDFDLSKGITEPDNMHFLLGTLGAAAMLAAIAQAPDSGHNNFGIAGGVAMGVAIKLTW